MATKNCPECGYVCKTIPVKDEPKGSWVIFECQNRECPSRKRGFPWKEKAFVPDPYAK